MNLRQYRAKAIPLIEKCLGDHFANEAREGHRGERGSTELEVVAQWAGPKLVGICGLGQEFLHRTSRGTLAQSVWLAYFAVHPDYRGRGIGRKLLARTEARAKKLGYEWMLIETYTHARFWGARQLYTHAGYQIINQEGSTLTYRKRLI